MNYYNDSDPQIAAWLHELVKRGLLPAGVIDNRDINEVQPDDLKGFTQCHFFAGIGGWPYALKLAGWPENKPVWTGSCPCQPFSIIGKKHGTKDKRHLWPVFFRLIKECKPLVVFGEQVEGAIKLGWFDGICADLEGEDYAIGACVLGAHSAGAPHIRQRLFWVAESCREGLERHVRNAATSYLSGWLDKEKARSSSKAGGAWSDFEYVKYCDGKNRRVKSGISLLVDGIPARVVRLRGYGNAIVPQTAAEFIKAYMYS